MQNVRGVYRAYSVLRASRIAIWKREATAALRCGHTFLSVLIIYPQLCSTATNLAPYPTLRQSDCWKSLNNSQRLSCILQLCTLLESNGNSLKRYWVLRLNLKMIFFYCWINSTSSTANSCFPNV